MEDLLLSLAVCWKRTLAQGGLYLCLYLSQLAFFRLTYVRRRPGLEGVFTCNRMRIDRWSALSINSVCQEHDVMREADANETSG